MARKHNKEHGGGPTHAIEALTAFYDTNVRIDGADSIELG